MKTGIYTIALLAQVLGSTEENNPNCVQTGSKFVPVEGSNVKVTQGSASSIPSQNRPHVEQVSSTFVPLKNSGNNIKVENTKNIFVPKNHNQPPQQSQHHKNRY